MPGHPSDAVVHGVVRKLWTADREAFADHLLRLDSESRLRRFQGLVSDVYLRGYADKAFAIDAVHYGFFDEGVLRAVAELHPLDGPIARQAEAAFSVEHAYQHHGIGTELFRRLRIAARNRGIRGLVLHCLPSNLAMQRLVSRFDGRVRIEDGEATAHLDAAPPTPFSFASEVIADGTGFAKAILDAELKALQPA